MNSTPVLAPYQSLSVLYYDLDDAHGAHEELPFYTSYAQNAHGPILEPMCGTGNFLIPLTRAGFDIEGFDASPFMLERLQQKSADVNVSCGISQNLIQDFESSKRYNLIFIPNASFNLLIDEDIIERSLKCMREHLAPHGRFVVEILTTNAIPSSINEWTHKSRMLPCGSRIDMHSYTIPLENTIVTTTHRYELVVDDTIVKIETELYRLRLHDVETFKTLLLEVGFSQVDVIKAFARNEMADPIDDIVVFDCVK